MVNMVLEYNFFSDKITKDDNDRAVDMIYLNLKNKKTFNSLPRSRLISKLEAHGVWGSLLRWN